MKKTVLLILAMITLNLRSQVYNAGTKYSTYYDIVPDSLLNYTTAPYTHETYSLDIFAGPGYDIEFTAHGAVSSGGSAQYMKVASLNPNVYILFGRWDSVFVPANQNYNVTKVAKPLVAGNAINAPGAVWDSTSLYLTDHSGSGGGVKNVNDFVGGDKYVGLKYVNKDYVSGTTVDYGWILVRCKTADSCYIKEFSHTNKPTAITETRTGHFMMFPNPVHDRFMITGENSDLIDLTSVQVKDVCGKSVASTCHFNNNMLEVKFDNIPAGLYFVNYVSNGQLITGKIIKTSGE